MQEATLQEVSQFLTAILSLSLPLSFSSPFPLSFHL